LYIEYESTNEASRIQKEIVGSGGIEYESIADLRAVHTHELEAKLILSSVVGLWNISENVIFEKNLSEAEGLEFGYSVGVSRPIAQGTSRAPSLLSRRVQAETDGALFWKISSGDTRAGMPSFSYLPAPERWQLVLHLRSLAKLR
jgi:hypothetical protein